MNYKIVSRSVFAGACFVVTVFSSMNVQAYDGSQYSKDAKITVKQAEAIALKSFPGTITEVSLRHENGGSGLRYSFDIRSHKKTHEVAVDAMTGKLLENDQETEDNDD